MLTTKCFQFGMLNIYNPYACQCNNETLQKHSLDLENVQKNRKKG
jgi:hypothetical protein